MKSTQLAYSSTCEGGHHNGARTTSCSSPRTRDGTTARGSSPAGPAAHASLPGSMPTSRPAPHQATAQRQQWETNGTRRWAWSSGQGASQAQRRSQARGDRRNLRNGGLQTKSYLQPWTPSRSSARRRQQRRQEHETAMDIEGEPEERPLSESESQRSHRRRRMHAAVFDRRLHHPEP